MLTFEQSKERQEELEALLREMSQKCMDNDELILPIIHQLSNLYKDDFRHSYSGFFPVIDTIAEKEKTVGDAEKCGLDALSTNIHYAKKFVHRNCTTGNKKFASLYKPLMKLSDHLNLEIARYNRFVGQNEQIMEQNKLLTSQNEQIKELKKQNQGLQKQLADATEKLDQANERFNATEDKLNAAETRLKDAETKLNDAEAKLKTIETDLPTATTTLNTLKKALIKVKKSLTSIHIDIIAVLGIFASIVLAFSGSMTVLGSALTGMQEVHAFKATFFVLLCGFVLGNIIFLLMYLVGKLTSRNIYARCKTENCTCEKPCNGFKRIRKRLPYIYWLNLILIVLMGLVVFFWYLDRSCHFNIFDFFDLFASRLNH